MTTLLWICFGVIITIALALFWASLKATEINNKNTENISDFKKQVENVKNDKDLENMKIQLGKYYVENVARFTEEHLEMIRQIGRDIKNKQNLMG